ncbi:MAG: DNA polymerase III subunit delta' [Acidobacteria bacterium]|nr:DNA polymerase III subunit delta' [Acidobacteriota bacterium]
MKYPVSLNTFLGNARAVEILKRAIEQDRLPHAMIFAGPAGVGKCTLALLIAQYLNCLSPLAGRPCGTCAACTRIMAVIESRHLQCLTSKGGEFCGSCSNCRIRTKRHPDIRLIEPEKTTIAIDQIRSLIEEIAFQPLEARYRVVVLDPAEQMRQEAHNSLLKTLEEPPSRTIIILITTNPYMLLETIRSRSRMLQFGEIPHEQIEEYLVKTREHSIEEARLAAALSGGSLAAALDFNTAEYQEIRRQALQFVVLLLKKGSFAEASSFAGRVTKDKSFFQLWIESVAVLLQDVYYAAKAVERVSHRDLLGKLQEIARDSADPAVIRSINAVSKLRGELQYNVNRQLALEAMFLALTQKI